jgi:O-antigen ligase
MDEWVMRIERILLLVILGTMPVIYAAVQPWIWAWYVAAVFFTFLWAYWRKEILLRDNGFGAVCVVYLFFLWTLFQITPLPGEWLARLSPFRADLLDKARELAGVKEIWPSMAYVHRMALQQWILWVGAFVLAMLVGRACRERGFLTSLAVMLLVVGGLEALYGLVQALVPNTGVLGYHKTGLGDARGTFINRNHFAGMIEMIWPVGLGYMLSLSEWEGKMKLKYLINSDYFNRQLLIAIVLVVMVLALVFSRSRAGIMGCFLGFLVFLGAMAFSGAGLRKGFWIGTGIGIFLLVVYGSQIGFESVINRFLALDTQENSRLDMWRDAWMIVQQHPFGVGPGNYQVLDPMFRVHFEGTTVTYQTHNDYLQLLVETGWPGFLLLTSGFLYVLVRGLVNVRQVYKRESYSPRFFVMAGAWSGLISLGWHSYFDFNLQIPANLFYFAMLIGMLQSVRHMGEPHSRKLRHERRAGPGERVAGRDRDPGQDGEAD